MKKRNHETFCLANDNRFKNIYNNFKFIFLIKISSHNTRKSIIIIANHEEYTL